MKLVRVFPELIHIYLQNSGHFSIVAAVLLYCTPFLPGYRSRDQR